MVQSEGSSATVIQNVLRIIKTCLGVIRVTDCRTFPNFLTSALQDGDESNFAQCAGCSRKKVSPKDFWQYIPND